MKIRIANETDYNGLAQMKWEHEADVEYHNGDWQVMLIGAKAGFI